MPQDNPENAQLVARTPSTKINKKLLDNCLFQIATRENTCDHPIFSNQGLVIA